MGNYFAFYGPGVSGSSSNGFFLDTRTDRQSGTQFTLQVCNILNGHCPTCQNITITLVDPPALAVAVDEPTLCPGKVTKLRVVNPDPGVTYTWQPGNMSYPTVVVSPTVSTTYTVTATNANGCTSQKTVRVQVRIATCPVCQPQVEQTHPDYAGGYTFLSGKTYYFPHDTRLSKGIYVAEEGATLLFEKGVTLTSAFDAGLVLEGATLTAVCDEQWGGIVIEPNGGLTAINVGKQQNEISHSHVAIDVSPKANFSGKELWNSLHLDGMRFLHNMRGLRLPGGAAQPGGVYLSDCLFDSDPTQMRVPYAYVSPTQQFCSYYHLNVNGDVSELKLQGNQLKHALFGVLAPDGTGLVSSETIFTECYIMGAMAYNQNSSLPSTWSENEFTFAPRNNPFVTPLNPFVAAAYDDLAQMGDFPDQVVSPGACTGLFASGEGLTLEGTQFWQPQALGSYNSNNLYPQIGLWAGPNTTYVHDGYFQNLHIGYVGQAQQTDGEVKGSFFSGCRTGVAFYNRDLYNPVGTVALTCNTFSQPVRFSADTYGARGIELGPQSYQSGNGLGGQVNLSSKFDPSSGLYVPILQTNRFTAYAGASANLWWHVYNSEYNPVVDYVYYLNQAGTGRVPEDATRVGDDGLSSGNANRVRLTRNTAGLNGAVVLLENGTGTNPNDCASLGYPDTGLQARLAAPPPALSAVYGLAQNVPNPCSGSTQVTYRLPEKTVAQLVIRDTYNGRVWQRETLSGGERTVEVNLRALPAGAYIYTLEVEGRAVAYKRLLVQ